MAAAQASGSMRHDDVVAQQLREITQTAAAAIARARGTSAMAADVLQQSAAGSMARYSTTARSSSPSARLGPDGGFYRPASPSLPPPNVALARESARRVSSPTPGGLLQLASPSPASQARDADTDSDDEALRGLPGYGDGTRAARRSKQAQQQAAAAEQLQGSTQGLQGLGEEHTGLQWSFQEQPLRAAGADEGGLLGYRASSDSPSSWQQGGGRRLSATGEATAAALSAAAASARRRSSVHEGAVSPADLAAAAVSRKASIALAAAAEAVGSAPGASYAASGYEQGSVDGSGSSSSSEGVSGQQRTSRAEHLSR
jgi:hypothetical protein